MLLKPQQQQCTSFSNLLKHTWTFFFLFSKLYSFMAYATEFILYHSPYCPLVRTYVSYMCKYFTWSSKTENKKQHYSIRYASTSPYTGISQALKLFYLLKQKITDILEQLAYKSVHLAFFVTVKI